MRATHSKTGFTLIELLVVIAIIVILAALLLGPAIKAKVQAKSAACKSNLRQLGIALRMSLDEDAGFPAAWIIRHGPGERSKPANLYAWPGRLQPYVANSRGVFTCPSSGQSSESLPKNLSELTQHYSLDYAYNAIGAALSETSALGLGYSTGLKESGVKCPSDMVAIYDTDLKGTIWPPPPPPPGDPGGGIHPGARPDTNINLHVSSRHNGGANVLFCDSHVEYAKRSNLIQEEDRARRRWNNDHEPHPEFW